MIDYDPAEPTIFIHIPKTAGASTRLVVREWFGSEFHDHYYNEQTGTLPSGIDLEENKMKDRPFIIYGHFNKNRGFGVEEVYPTAKQFITILRDPFEVATSMYFFIRKISNNLKDKSLIPATDLERYLFEEPLNILNHFPREVTMANFRDEIDKWFIEVGITEHLSLSMERIARKLGKPFDPAALGHINRAERDLEVPYHLREAFRQRHPLEHAVYDFALERLLKP